MGKARQACRVPNASGRRSVGRLVARFALNESGATAIEYGLIVALIAATIIGAVTYLSQSIKDNLYDVIQAAILGGGGG
ncbi:MAG: Flp family type IVb pilin [Parcubacteria group bacterium]